MRNELYAHKDLGCIDITALLRDFPEGGLQIGWLPIDEAPMDDPHEYDAVRLTRLRGDGLGLYNPILVVIRERIGDTALKVDIIDGWHRMKVLEEIGAKRILAFLFDETTIKKFIVDPKLFKGGNELEAWRTQPIKGSAR